MQGVLARAGLLGFLRLPPPVLRTMVGRPRRSPEGHELDLQVQALLWLMRFGPEPQRVGLERLRRLMDRNASLTDRQVPGVRARELAAPLPMRLDQPPTEGPLPVIVYFHGGGWVIGSVESHDGVCRALAAGARALVVSVDYRRAPEHRFPAAADDALAAARWVLANAHGFGGDPDRVALAGDSAGGTLAAVAALDLRKDARRPVFQLLVYPAADLTRGHASHQHFREGYLLTRPVMDWFLERYTDQHTHPRASPLYQPDLAGAPPAFIMTAGFDPLRDEGRAYADKLRAAGVAAEQRTYHTLIHGFFSMAGAIDAAARAFDEAVSALAAALARG